MKKITKLSISALTTVIFVSPIVACSNKSPTIGDKELKNSLSQNIQLLQENINIINDKKTNSELKKIVEKQILLIEKSNDFLHKNLSHFKIHFNVDYFNKFKNDFIEESKLIIKPFEKKDQEIINNEKIKSEIFKLSAHTITIKNFLTSSYDSLLNKDIFNPLHDWQKVNLEKEAYEYYQPILGKKGEELVEELQKLLYTPIKPKSVNFGKSKKYNELWELFKKPGYKDLERGREKYILDIYSKNPLGKNIKVNFEDKDKNSGGSQTLGKSYNREHLIPQSHFKKNGPMYHDANHIFPTDSYTNGKRSNFDHGIVVEEFKNYKFDNQSKLGIDKNKNKVFEPIDAFKGDIARSYLYFAICYYPQVKNFEEKAVFENQYPYIKKGYLEQFINWHESIDLVDMYDLNRNKEVYKHQNNRNPFIDIPYLSKWIWNKNYQNIPLTFNQKTTTI